MFYAALILSSLTTVTAAAAASVMSVCGFAAPGIEYSDQDVQRISEMTTDGWHRTDAFIGDSTVAYALLEPWMQPLVTDLHHLPLLECTKRELSKCVYGWPA